MHALLFEFIDRYMPLTTEEREAILALDIFKVVKKGELLLKEGQFSRDSYFVLKGCLRTFYLIDGEERTTGFYTEMEAFTPPCVIGRGPSDCYVDCLEEGIVTVTNADLGDEMNKRFPRFEMLCRRLSEELLAKQQLDFDAFKMSSPEQRYLNLMRLRPDLIQRVPQYHLASFLGIKPQSLSRLRARLQQKG